MCILDGTVLAASDGSYFPTEKVAACVWIVSSPCLTEYIQGDCVLPGDYADHTAYRAKLGGQTGIAYFFHHLLLEGPITLDASVVLSSTDCLSCVNRLSISSEFFKSRFQHMRQTIVDLWEKSRFSPSLTHVYGHADSQKSSTGRVPLELLNIQMDQLAKEIALDHISIPNGCPPTYCSEFGIGTVLCNGKYICSRLQQSLYTATLHQEYIQGAAAKFGVSVDFFQHSVAWTSFGKARSSAQFGMFKFIPKLLCGDLATGQVMVNRRQRLSPACPVCGEVEETTLHMLTCPLASSVRVNLLLQFKLWLLSVKTDPTIIRYFIAGLSSWFQKTNLTYHLLFF